MEKVLYRLKVQMLLTKQNNDLIINMERLSYCIDKILWNIWKMFYVQKSENRYVFREKKLVTVVK